MGSKMDDLLFSVIKQPTRLVVVSLLLFATRSNKLTRMPMSYPVMIIVIALALIVFVSIIVFISKKNGNGPTMSTYKGTPTPDMERVATKLALNVYPIVKKSSSYTKKDVDALLGNDPAFNAELYGIFRQHVAAGRFDREKFLKALS